MKKVYVSPAMAVVIVNTTAMMSSSILDPESPSVTVNDEEWHGAFGTKENSNSWSDIWE
ncbi:MAG: hypothetical protein IJ767_08235 [Bacteroidaceae bacterium]|nr:hypothetical protein [Bacteroidaceae bacterium]